MFDGLYSIKILVTRGKKVYYHIRRRGVKRAEGLFQKAVQGVQLLLGIHCFIIEAPFRRANHNQVSTRLQDS